MRERVECGMTPCETVPDSILWTIFGFLPTLRDRSAAALVCVRWSSILADPVFWSALVVPRFMNEGRRSAPAAGGSAMLSLDVLLKQKRFRHVTQVDLTNVPEKVDSRVLNVLEQRCVELESLAVLLDSRKAPLDSLAAIAPRLKSLSLFFSPYWSEPRGFDAMATLIAHCSRLEHGSFRRFVDDRSLQTLAGFGTVESIELNYCYKVSDGGLARFLLRSPRLHVLKLISCTNLTSAWIAHLLDLHSAASPAVSTPLSLEVDPYTYPHGRADGRVTLDLGVLWLNEIEATDAYLRAVAPLCQHLCELHVTSSAPVFPAGLAVLTQHCALLRSIRIRVSAESAEACLRLLVAECPRLEYLHVMSSCSARIMPPTPILGPIPAPPPPFPASSSLRGMLLHKCGRIVVPALAGLTSLTVAGLTVCAVVSGSATAMLTAASGHAAPDRYLCTDSANGTECVKRHGLSAGRSLGTHKLLAGRSAPGAAVGGRRSGSVESETLRELVVIGCEECAGDVLSYECLCAVVRACRRLTTITVHKAVRVFPFVPLPVLPLPDSDRHLAAPYWSDDVTPRSYSARLEEALRSDFPQLTVNVVENPLLEYRQTFNSWFDRSYPSRGRAL